MPRFDVAVVGELNLDLILYGLPETLEPERELYSDRMSLTLGSSSAIFAHNLASLGSRVGFISRIGDDPLGRISLERLAEGGVDVSKVRKIGGPTTSGLTVILQQKQFRNILTYPGTIHEMCFEDLDFDYLRSARHFHLASYYLHRALIPRIAELFRLMKEAGLSTSLDTNDDPEDRWDGGIREVLKFVDIFLPNGREAQKITRLDSWEAALENLAEQVPLVVVKLGAQGAVARRGKEKIATPALSVEPVDPVGAGDSFNAGFLHCHLAGADLKTSLAFGNRAAAFSTTRPGGTEAFRDKKRRQEFFRKHEGAHPSGRASAK